MAVNPMQRKARQSFLLGMLLMLVIAAIVVALLFMQIMNMKKAEEATTAASKTVYVLSADKKSGEPITQDDVVRKTLVTSIAKDELVVIDDLPENPEDAEPTTVPKEVQAKIDLGKGTILTQSMIVNSDEIVENSLRIQEYNMIVLPASLSNDDYIDIRLLLPNGQDYIVISKKRVIKSSEKTIFIKMTEEEIVMMSNAIVESYITEGSMLYAAKYTDPGIQVASTPTYLASKDVLDLISIDKNITATALNALYERYNSSPGIRDHINNVVSANMDDYEQKVTEGLETQIKKAQEERSEYLEVLGEGY